MKGTLYATIALSAFGLGTLYQSHNDRGLVVHATEQRLGVLYQTPKGDNWALAHVYVPACTDGHVRVVDTPERDEVDALTVYCYDGDAATKDELAEMAGNQ